MKSSSDAVKPSAEDLKVKDLLTMFDELDTRLGVSKQFLKDMLDGIPTPIGQPLNVQYARYLLWLEDALMTTRECLSEIRLVNQTLKQEILRYRSSQ